MQPLSQRLNSVTTLYRESKHSTRWTLAVCLLVVVLSVVILFSRSTIEMEYLFAGREFSPSEISQITQSFSVAQLDQWETSGNQVEIPRAQRAQYLTALQGKFDVDSMTSVVDTVLQQGHFLDTASLRDLRLRNAKEKDLAKMLMQIPGIEEARVNIDVQHERGLSGGTKMVALAALKATGNSTIGMDTAESIREIIAARYAGLQRSQVVVIDLNSGYTFGSSSDVFPSSDEDMAMRHYERWWKNRIEYLLSDIPLKRIEVSLRIAGNVPLANPDDPTHPQSRVRASVSIGIPHSYVRQVALEQMPNPANLTPEQFQAAVREQESQIKQNVTTLIKGVVPIVPRSVIEPLQINVATIVDLGKTTLSHPPHDPVCR